MQPVRISMLIRRTAILKGIFSALDILFSHFSLALWTSLRGYLKQCQEGGTGRYNENKSVRIVFASK
jgi:hypothetical protein